MSGRNTRIIIGAIIVAGLIGVAALAYFWFSGGEATPSTETVSDTLPLTLTARASAATTTPTAAPDAEATEAAPEITEVAVSNVVEATVEATTEATAEATTAANGAPAAGIFNIVGEESQVSFDLTEELRGQFTVVRGVTRQVAGQIFVDFANPSETQVGVIRVNARTLATDNEFRNRAIRGQILRSAQPEYEFIEFTPTAIEGLPPQVAIGQRLMFQIVGDLVIQGRSQSVTFDAIVTPVSEDRLEGTATTVVQRAMYGLTIPNAPGVANVAEDVTLTLNFVAEREA
jgi:polyisoprenoid-binding protein YceI